jgi:hypothetical protein
MNRNGRAAIMMFIGNPGKFLSQPRMPLTKCIAAFFCGILGSGLLLFRNPRIHVLITFVPGKKLLSKKRALTMSELLGSNMTNQITLT